MYTYMQKLTFEWIYEYRVHTFNNKMMKVKNPINNYFVYTHTLTIDIVFAAMPNKVSDKQRLPVQCALCTACFSCETHIHKYQFFVYDFVFLSFSRSALKSLKFAALNACVYILYVYWFTLAEALFHFTNVNILFTICPPCCCSVCSAGEVRFTRCTYYTFPIAFDH